jgi:hypothetical protein
MPLSDWWDKIKNKIPKLVEVKANLTESGDVHQSIGGKHYHSHIHLPKDVSLSDLLATEVTPEKEREYLENFRKIIDARLQALPLRSEDSLNQAIVEASTASAVEVLTRKIEIHDKVGVREHVKVELSEPDYDNSVMGEEAGPMVVSRSDSPRKKSWNSDEGETM